MNRTKIATSHDATFPPKLVEPCILAGSRPGDVVLDPFAGVFTVALVAQQLGRASIMIELNREYVLMGVDRMRRYPPPRTTADTTRAIEKGATSNVL